MVCLLKVRIEMLEKILSLLYNKMDYRYADSENPIEALRDRTCDNTSVGRKPI